MKFFITLAFIIAILSSCSKEAHNVIPDPPEGAYEIIFYDQQNNVVFNSKGDAFYVGVNNGTQIRLDDAELTQTINPNPNEVAYIVFQLNYKPNSPGVIDTSKFDGFLWQGRYIEDWRYETQRAELRVTEVTQDKIQGEFTITVTSVGSPNPNWGNHITIKGKFFARCRDHC
jgi:hypothetical protein